jgi:selenocysteine-specific elongation factor
MRSVVFATAGHIDHGKTSLVAALTGVSGDRLAEEKRRGITIVLGFAPLADQRGELDVSFIDVPGHERLVHTMIAGVGAVDRSLLVVAADEGVMPQTREHLDVLELLGVRGGVVALSKTDLVDAPTLTVRREELNAALAGGPLDRSPIVPCSVVSGDGIEELRAAVLSSAREARRGEERHRAFRLGIDRVFSVTGTGTVTTGTVRWGEARVGDELAVLPGGRRVRVRALQVHGEPRTSVGVGERAAIALAGAAVKDVPLGDQLLGAGPWFATERMLLRLRTLAGAPTLDEGDEVGFHLLSGRCRARFERLHPAPLPPGRRGLAIVRLSRPTFVAPGDRIVLRRLSPAATVAGGEVVDPAPPRVRQRDSAVLEARPDPRAALEATLTTWIAEGGPAGLELDAIAGRLGVLPEGLEATLGRLLDAGAIRAARTSPPIFVAASCIGAIDERATDLLAAAGQEGIPVAELVERTLPSPAAHLRDFYLEAWRRAGFLRESGGRAVAATLEPIEDPLTGRIEAAYREAAFDVPGPDEMAIRLGANPKVVEGLVRSLVARGRLVRLAGRWVVARSAVDEVIAGVRAWGVESFDVAAFKARFGLTRKLAIPLLEWLDSARVTRREADHRKVLPPRAGVPLRG